MLISSNKVYGHTVKNQYFCSHTETYYNDERFIRKNI